VLNFLTTDCGQVHRLTAYKSGHLVAHLGDKFSSVASRIAGNGHCKRLCGVHEPRGSNERRTAHMCVSTMQIPDKTLTTTTTTTSRVDSLLRNTP